MCILPLKAPTAIAGSAADCILNYYFFFHFLKKISLDISCESSAMQMIPINVKTNFSEK